MNYKLIFKEDAKKEWDVDVQGIEEGYSSNEHPCRNNYCYAQRGGLHDPFEQKHNETYCAGRSYCKATNAR